MVIPKKEEKKKSKSDRLDLGRRELNASVDGRVSLLVGLVYDFRFLRAFRSIKFLLGILAKNFEKSED